MPLRQPMYHKSQYKRVRNFLCDCSILYNIAKSSKVFSYLNTPPRLLNRTRPYSTRTLHFPSLILLDPHGGLLFINERYTVIKIILFCSLVDKQWSNLIAIIAVSKKNEALDEQQNGSINQTRLNLLNRVRKSEIRIYKQCMYHSCVKIAIFVKKKGMISNKYIRRRVCVRFFMRYHTQ